MAGSRAGLRKVQKTVRTKKGTARRTYWVKGAQAPKKTKTLRQSGNRGAEHTNAKKLYTAGLIIAGANAGNLAHAHLRKGNSAYSGHDLGRQIGSMIGGGLAGYGLARLTRNRMSTHGLRLGGAAAGFGGAAMGMGAVHRMSKNSMYDNRRQRVRQPLSHIGAYGIRG